MSISPSTYDWGKSPVLMELVEVMKVDLLFSCSGQGKEHHCIKGNAIENILKKVF